MSHITFSKDVPWDLRQRGLKDAARHDVRIKDAIKKNLKELIAHEDIIISDGAQRIRIPMKYLDQYRFKVGSPQQGAGQGAGNIGDIVWQPSTQPGTQPGDQPGEHGYEAEVDKDTLTKMMLEDFALPWLESKPSPKDVEAEEIEWTDRRRTGMPGNLHIRQTLKENIKRNAARGVRGVEKIIKEDLRYKAWRIQTHPVSRAAVYLLTDWSGSMTTEKRYIAKAMCYWIVQFLRLKYDHIDIVFIAHDTHAEIVSEHDFFGKSEGGGTLCSSAYIVTLQEITRRHPKSLYNTYVWHFSDGENIESDNAVCVRCINDLLQECTMVAYAEIAWQQGSYVLRNLWQALQSVVHQRFLTTILKTRADIQHALRVFLGAEISTSGK